ncbi:bacteriohemerythrin [Ferrigenium kumadai]|uniref:bacteriohemerythrin n=1 Tax=Ferrigenium kumadai TaxID=1682490 RepID=UPI001BB3E353|nr:hemerythrin domain-containing protein [Ferrigenium kumadai]
MRERIMTLTWTEQLSVGNAIIDSEHRNLIGLINSVEHALRSGNEHALSHAFKLLTDCVRLHFMNEEKIAQAAELPFEQHKQSHQYLQKELQYIRDELEAKSGMWSEGAVEHFTRTLGNWMMDHLSGEDKLLKPALLTLPSDFSAA